MHPAPPISPEQQDAEASQWTLQGIALLEKGDRDSLKAALGCFERAIFLREGLPLDGHPLYRWGLTAGWMNRGDVLTRLGTAEGLIEALRCYDIAIAHLHALPLEAEPVFRWRLSVAWMNRGITEQTLGDVAAEERALTCFERALQVMEGHESSPRPDYQHIQASAWMNRANAQLRLPVPDWLAVAASARRALGHSRRDEAQAPAAAEAGIKARYILCQALAHLLESPPVEADLAERWILEATDAVEEVMRLTAEDERYLPLREEIFHFGCRIYRAFQPHFLAEFLEDGQGQGPRGLTPAMRAAAQESLTQAAAQIRQENLAGYTPSRLERLVQTLQSLSEAGHKLGFQVGK